MIGYNPNRDSGIAEPRSYVEIGKEDLQGLVEEYDFVPTATRRYFAQLVYNVGPGSGGGGGGSQFNQAQYEALLALIDVKNELIGIATQAIKTFTINLDTAPEESDITKELVIISVKYNEDTHEYDAVPVPDPEDVPENYNYAEYLINVPGYVCNVECYNWLTSPEESLETTPTMERLLPKITYDPTIGKFGTTTIFLDKQYEYDAIRALPEGKRLLKISYTQIPVEQHN